MEILKIIETLQSYTEDVVAYKLDRGFAHAVSEAVSMLVAQGERIADLEKELADERYRHDRVQDFEVAEAEELRKARERIRELEDQNRWIPVTERLPKLIQCGAGTAYSEAVNVLTSGRKVMVAIWDGIDWLCDMDYWDAWGEEITHWAPVLLPLPEAPKEDA